MRGNIRRHASESSFTVFADTFPPATATQPDSEETDARRKPEI